MWYFKVVLQVAIYPVPLFQINPPKVALYTYQIQALFRTHQYSRGNHSLSVPARFMAHSASLIRLAAMARVKGKVNFRVPHPIALCPETGLPPPGVP